MKKLLRMSLITALMLSFSMTAFAAEDKTITTESSDTTSVNYQVNPTFTITIPLAVKLGETATITAENVVVAKGKQVEVILSGTSGESNAFTLKNQEDALINYTVKKADGYDLSMNSTVLTVNPMHSNSGSTTLSFTAPDSVTYAGDYTGTVTFTVGVYQAVGF